MDDHRPTAEGPSPWHVALVAEPSGITRRLAQTLGQLAEHGVPGCELELAAGPETLGARHHDLVHAITGGDAAAEALRLARGAGAAAELIENGRTGCLVPPDPVALSAAIVGLARRATLLERLATGGLRATGARSWQSCLAALAGVYAHALAPEPVARAA